MKTFNDRIMGIFSSMETNYDAMNNLMQDVALGREIYDDESGRKISKAEANAKIYDFSLKVLGINDVKNSKEVRRGLEDNGREWFRIIEDTVDTVITVGLQENEWFNDLVESKTIGYHDRQDFYTEEEAFLSVAKAGTSHHDHILQRLPAGSPISIPTALYVVKIGADINRYIANPNQVSWDKLVTAIAKAFTLQIQEDIYAQVAVAVNQIPARFKSTGALVKNTFDQIIGDVSAANNGAQVVIMGTKPALSKITSIADVNWAATAQKDNVMNTGLIGIYEGTRLVELPTRFKDKSYASYVFPTNKLLIMPVIGDEGKFIKFIDEGDTNILEKMERGDYLSDLQTYEVQRRFGTGVVLGRMFGNWDI